VAVTGTVCFNTVLCSSLKPRHGQWYLAPLQSIYKQQVLFPIYKADVGGEVQKKNLMSCNYCRNVSELSTSYRIISCPPHERQN